MKTTGIVRRIDDLGRVVIPKEIRRRLNIREGDPLEIFTLGEGEVRIKKYSPMGEMEFFAKQYAGALVGELGGIVCITDMDEIIAVEGGNLKNLIGKSISHELEKVALERKIVRANIKDRNFIKIVDEELEIKNEILCPIISSGDVVGTVLFMNNKDSEMGDLEEKLVKCAAIFLAKQFE
ncbi:MAG: AbrB/MazE/SpoVT family DNA-binding domain-containing protein [Lachnospiraceae bacterium]|nr:AbrB/MazE/SpoVT family DNA-binding domain-containing protein [Lachnospiraceae bacterium]